MEAVALREIDKDYRNHLQAFLDFCAQGQRKNGKPVYSKFEKFYDYQAEERRVKKKRNGMKDDRFAALKKFLRNGGNLNG